MLDDTVRWTGMPARIADQIAGVPDSWRRPTRWLPILPIAFSCALLIISLAWPVALDGMPSGAIIGVIVSFWGGILALVFGINANGPLAKTSLEDDERETALRKDSLLFCFLLLAVLNCLGQPVLLVLSHWKAWPFAQTASVATAAFMLNATLLGCLPTLYASWKMRQLPRE
jgi:hypothetical protein